MPLQFRYAEWLVIILATLFVVMGLRDVYLGDSLSSRLATAWSLTHAGTWHIDQPENPFTSLSVDKCELGGRMLSTKPPVIPLLITAQYLAMDTVTGVNLEEKASLKRFIQSITLTLSVIPFTLLLICFRSIMYRLSVPDLTRLQTLIMLAFATQLPGFSAQFNNHIPATAMLVVSLLCVITISQAKSSTSASRIKLYYVVFGISGGLVFTMDLPLTIFVVFLGLYLLWHYPVQTILWGGLGMLIPLGVHFATMLWVTGSLLPVQVRPELYLYEASYWRNPMGIDALNEPKGTYLFHMTFGRHGIFSLFPVLLVGVVGAILATFRKDFPGRPYILACSGAIVILFTYYVLRTNNYGGAAYGFRWALGIMPLLLLMGIPVTQYLLNKKLGRIVLAVLMLISIYSAWECYNAPWGENLEWTSRYLFGSSF